MTDDPKDSRGYSNKRPRGFAAMDPKVVSEIARKGGREAHRSGLAYEFTSETARIAGRKGGEVHARKMAAKRVAAQSSPPAESETPPTIDEKPPVG